ncbi:tetratricopeptide repeat protein [Fibrobacter succinogenes]
MDQWFGLAFLFHQNDKIAHAYSLSYFDVAT